MTSGELEKKLLKAGIKGDWVDPDEFGFSRTFQFEVNGQKMEIEWYCNYSTLMVGNIHFWFDEIITNSTYLHRGEWIGFSFRNEHPIHLRIKEE